MQTLLKQLELILTKLGGFLLGAGSQVECDVVRATCKAALFPGSSTPEREIELMHAERAWYFFSHENLQR